MARYLESSDAWQCKGRIKPTRKGRSFCWRVRKDGKYPDEHFLIELHSNRTGKLIGYLATRCGFSPKKDRAMRLSTEYMFNAEVEIGKCLFDAQSGSNFPWEKKAKSMVKAVVKAAERAVKK